MSSTSRVQSRRSALKHDPATAMYTYASKTGKAWAGVYPAVDAGAARRGAWRVGSGEPDSHESGDALGDYGM